MCLHTPVRAIRSDYKCMQKFETASIIHIFAMHISFIPGVALMHTVENVNMPVARVSRLAIWCPHIISPSPRTITPTTCSPMGTWNALLYHDFTPAIDTNDAGHAAPSRNGTNTPVGSNFHLPSDLIADNYSSIKRATTDGQHHVSKKSRQIY